MKNKIYNFGIQATRLFVVAMIIGYGFQTKGQLVGALPGAIDVSPTGAATYSIPIEVVPGTQGMQPNLSIVYNSQAGNGSLGMKWDLAGLSAITRIGQTMYFDNNITDIRWNSDDRFALDGNRLIVINGNYGANGTQYATEMENFSKITSYIVSGSVYFEVITDNGTTIEYGKTSDSRMELGATAIWMISKITDIHGNYMTFTYIKDNGNGLPWIQEIGYTGGTNLSPYAKVLFTYIDNTATKNTSLYMGGYEYKKTRLLKNITVKYDNVTVREYQFTYTQDTKYNRLSKINLEIGNSIVLNPTTIDWGNIGVEKTVTDISVNRSGITITGDFNGDGITDILVYNQGSGVTRTYNVYCGDGHGNYYYYKDGTTAYIDFGNAYAVDIDGDGKDEFVFKDGISNLLFYSKFDNQVSYGLISHTAVNQVGFGDFNGDGKIDIAYDVIIRDSKNKPLYKYIYFCTDISKQPLYQFSVGLEDKWYTCDFNGDGITDIAYTNGSKMIIWGCNSTGNINEILYNEGYPTRWHQCYFGDFNGDGISDILTYVKDNQSNDLWEIHLGTGTGYAWSSTTVAPPLFRPIIYDGISSIFNEKIPIIADFDGDGKDDILQVVNNMPVIVTLFLTRNITASQYSCKYISSTKNWYPYSYLYGCVDMNQDGKMDLLYDNKEFLSFYANGEDALVKKFTDGIGVETELEYDYFTNNMKSARKWLSAPMVKVLKQSNGLGTQKNKTTFLYNEAVFNYKRKTFLGFKWFITENDGIYTSYFFEDDQNNNLLLPKRITTYIGASKRNRVTIGIQEKYTDFLFFGNKRFLMYESLVISHDSLNNNFTHTTTSLYTTGDFKGRTKEVCSEQKLTANTTLSYEFKSTKQINYVSRTVNANGYTIVCPSSVISKEQINGSSLVKTHTVDYSYYSNSPNLQYVLETSDHGYRKKEFSNYTYGMPQTVIETAENTPGNIRMDYTYDSKRRFVIQEKSQNTNVVQYTYDNKTGNVLSVKDINNLTTSYQYDNLGRKIKTTYPDGTRDSIVFTYGNSVNIPNCVYHVKLYSTGKAMAYTFYDKLGRELVRGESGLQSNTETRYDFLGKVEKVSLPYTEFNTSENEKIWQRYAYDKYGRITSEKGPYTDICYYYSPKTVNAYDKLRGALYIKKYDAVSRLVSSDDPSGTINYSYSLQKDNNNKVCNKTEISAFGDAKRTTTIITDSWGNRLSLADPDAGTITNTYNGLGQLLTQTDANGVVSNYTYDNFGRQTQITMTNNGQTNTVAYTYDANGKKGTLSSEIMQPDNTSITYAYDNYMRLKNKKYKNITNNQELEYSYSYNAAGQIDTVKYPYNFTIKHNYDAFGRLREIKRVDNSPMSIYLVHDYAPKWKFPSFWQTGATGTIVQQNHAGLLTDKITGMGEYKEPGFEPMKGGGISGGTENPPGTGGGMEVLKFFVLKDSNIQYLGYQYDNAGRMSMRARDLAYTFFGSFSWADYQNREYFMHDNIDRLTNADWCYIAGISVTPGPSQQGIYRWENLFSTTYSQNRMASNTAIGTYTYDHSTKPHALMEVELYDENTIPFAPCSTTYTLFNKVKTIDEGDYSYDITYYPNKNQAITTLKEDGTVISQKQYAGKAFEIDYETDKKYFYVYAYGQPVAVFIQDGNNAPVPYFIHTDHLGSIDVITDENGNIVDEMCFDAWGNRRSKWIWSQKESGVTHLIDRGFTGHQHLDVFNLINMGGRVYDPVTQQFLSPDPYVQFPDNTQNLNRYSYCMNSPLMFTDPTGEKMKWWGWLAIGLGVDALTGGAISTFAISTATATAAGAIGLGGAVYTFTTSTAIAASGLLSSIDFLVSAGRSIWNNDPQHILNWGYLEASQFITLFSSPFFYDNNAHWYEWIPQVINNFTGGEMLQNYVGKTLGHALNIGGKIEESQFYKGRLINRTPDGYLNEAISFGNCIYGDNIAFSPSDYDHNTDLFAHEFGHTYQSRISGPLYLFRYGLSSVAFQGSSEWDANRRGFGNLGMNQRTSEVFYSKRGYSTYKWWENVLSPVLYPFMWSWNK